MYKKIMYVLFVFLLFGMVDDYGKTVKANTEESSTQSEKNSKSENDVYIIEFNSTDKNKNKEKIEKMNGKIHNVFKNFNYISASLNKKDIEKLKKDKEIKKIAKNDNIKITFNEETNGIDTESLSKTENNWGYNAININENYTGKGVKIGILDSGIKSHDEYHITGGVDCYTESETLCSWNYTDDYGHGTFIAGITSSNRNDGEVKGVAPNSELYAIKFYEPTVDNEGKLVSGNMEPENFLRALDWAIESDIDVLNMSFVLGENSNDSLPLLNAAINTAVESQMYIVAAAGNGEDINGFPRNNPLVTVVSATYKNKDDNTINFVEEFTKGEFIDITAPGYKIYSTGLNLLLTGDLEKSKKYRYGNGTSYASPFVTGTVALAKQQFPTYSNDDIFALLMLNTKKVTNHDNVWDEKVGYGLLQANFQKTIKKLNNNLHLSTNNIGSEIPKVSAKTNEVQPSNYLSQSMFNDNNVSWYQIQLENQRAKWISLGNDLTEKVPFKAVIDNNDSTSKLFDNEETSQYNYATIYKDKTAMFRFENPVQLNGFDIKFHQNRQSQMVKVNFYDYNRKLIKSIPLTEDGVYDFDTSGEQIYYFEIKNVNGTDVYISEFEVLGKEFPTPKRTVDYKGEITLSSDDRTFYNDINDLTNGENKKGLKNKTFTISKGAKWSDYYNYFDYVLVSNEELGIHNKWIPVKYGDMSEIYKTDLTSSTFGQVIKDENDAFFSALDNNEFSYSYLKPNKISEYEFDNPVNLNAMLIKAHPTFVDNAIQMILTDKNGNTFEKNIGDLELFHRYFNFDETFQDIKKIKLINKTQIWDVKLAEIAFFGEDNGKKGIDPIAIKHPITLSPGGLKLYDEPKGKTYETFALSTQVVVDATQVFGYGSWAKVDVNGQEKWVDTSQYNVTIPPLMNHGVFDKIGGKVTKQSNIYETLSYGIDNNSSSIVTLKPNDYFEYEWNTPINTNQIYFKLSNNLDDSDNKINIILYDEQKNELFNKTFTRDELYKRLINFDKKYTNVKSFKIANVGKQNIKLAELDFREY